MTGLDCNRHTFIEAAIIITDKNLKVLSESPNIIIHQSDEVLETMEDWCKEHHAIVNILYIYIFYCMPTCAQRLGNTTPQIYR